MCCRVVADIVKGMMHVVTIEHKSRVGQTIKARRTNHEGDTVALLPNLGFGSGFDSDGTPMLLFFDIGAVRVGTWLGMVMLRFAFGYGFRVSQESAPGMGFGLPFVIYRLSFNVGFG